MRVPILIAMLVAMPAVCPAQNGSSVVIAIPAFDGSRSGASGPILGKRAAAILGLQISRTLRAAPTPNPKQLNFGRGDTSYYFKDPPPSSFEEAEALADDKKTQLILWGQAFPYAGGIIVEPYLSLGKMEADSSVGANIWQIQVSLGDFEDSLDTISVEVPYRRFQFAPIVIKSDLLPKLQALTGLKIYDRPGGRVINHINDNFTAEEQAGDYTKVSLPRGKGGWVYLPNLSDTGNQSEVVYFCGGLIRFFRHDWAGAIDLLKIIVGEDNRARKQEIQMDPPVSLQISTYLFMAVAADKLNDQKSSFSYLKKAYALNPYVKATTQYLCMSYLSQFTSLTSKNVEDREARRLLQSSLRDVLAKNKFLFGNNDQWLENMNRIAAEIAPR